MRLKKIPYARDFLKENEHTILIDKDLDIKRVEQTGNSEIAIEIGCGKGDFILAKAADNKNIQYYAIEKFASVLVRAVEKHIESGSENLLFMLGDADDLGAFFPKNSIQTIYLNFSDPWPKKRHEKRRLTYKKRLDFYKELLKTDGAIEIKTDNRGLFEFSLLELSMQNWIIEELSLDLHKSDAYEIQQKYKTEYEQRFLKKGQSIYYLRASVRS